MTYAYLRIISNEILKCEQWASTTSLVPRPYPQEGKGQVYIKQFWCLLLNSVAPIRFTPCNFICDYHVTQCSSCILRVRACESMWCIQCNAKKRHIVMPITQHTAPRRSLIVCIPNHFPHWWCDLGTRLLYNNMHRRLDTFTCTQKWACWPI